MAATADLIAIVGLIVDSVVADSFVVLDDSYAAATAQIALTVDLGDLRVALGYPSKGLASCAARQPEGP